MSALIDPRTAEDLIVFYFSWILILFLLHMFFDKISAHTHEHNWFKLNSKIPELYTAASVASSLLLGIIVSQGFQNHPLFDSNAMLVPLILSAISGTIVGVSSLIPKAER